MPPRFPTWICLSAIAVAGLILSVGTTSRAAAAENLTDADRKLDCPGVRAAVADVTVQIKRTDALLRKETAAPPTSLAQMMTATPPTPTALLAKALKLRFKALDALAAAKGCNRLDNLAKSRLGGAVKPEKPAAERCDVRGELGLQDCAEDVAKWRCRAEAGKGRAYIVCLDQVAERLITASGYDVATLAHYDPGCIDATAPATCSIFADNRSGPETKWCKRTSEASIDVCEAPKSGTPAIVADAGSKPAKAAAPVAHKPVAATLPPGTICRPVPCRLGTSCNRLCGPPD
jgi:hypothetical protein